MEPSSCGKEFTRRKREDRSEMDNLFFLSGWKKGHFDFLVSEEIYEFVTQYTFDFFCPITNVLLARADTTRTTTTTRQHKTRRDK